MGVSGGVGGFICCSGGVGSCPRAVGVCGRDVVDRGVNDGVVCATRGRGGWSGGLGGVVGRSGSARGCSGAI